jgi:hypothetical protein
VLKVQHNAGGTTSKKKGGGATLYPILHLSQYHVTGGHTGKQASKQASKIILGKTLQGVEGYHIYGHRITGNFDTSRLATLHGLLDDPLPSSRAIVGILEPAAKVEPHIMVAAG